MIVYKHAMHMTMKMTPASLLFFLPIHLGGFEGGGVGVLLYLQREGGLRTRQGRRVKIAEKERRWFYLSPAAWPKTGSVREGGR